MRAQPAAASHMYNFMANAVFLADLYAASMCAVFLGDICAPLHQKRVVGINLLICDNRFCVFTLFKGCTFYTPVKCMVGERVLYAV